MIRTDTSRLKAAIDLRQLIAEDLELKNNKAKCPFHQEKTASFVVHEKFYKCFGCGASGDVFTWLIQYKGFNFHDAVAHLQSSLGISVVVERARAPREAETLAIEAAGWWTAWRNALQAGYAEGIVSKESLDDHCNAPKKDIIAHWRKIRTPYLAAKFIAEHEERLCWKEAFRACLKEQGRASSQNDTVPVLP